MKRILMSLSIISAVVVVAIGATGAYFSDTETSTGNTFTAGTIDLKMGMAVPVFEDIKPCEDLSAVVITFENVGQNEGTLTFAYSYKESDKVEDDDPDLFEFAANLAGEGHNTLPATGVPGMEMDFDQFAKLIYVKSSNQDGCDNLANLVNWADSNSDGLVSLYELSHAGSAKWWDMKDGGVCIAGSPTDDVFNAGQTSTVTIEFHLAHAFETSCHSNVAYTEGMNTYAGDYCIYAGAAPVWNVPQADGVSLDMTATLNQIGY